MPIQQKLVNVRGERIAVVAGLRTPFVRRNSEFKECYATDLGIMVTNELLNRLPLAREVVEKFIFGQVIQQPDVPNLAREIALTLSMPHAQAYTLSSSCITGLQAVANVCNGIISGSISCGLAGGADSISNAPISLKPKVSRTLRDILRTSSYSKKFNLFKRLSWDDVKLQQVNLRDALTGYSLGDISEQMAQNFDLSREQLDQYTALSHQRAEQAWQQGMMSEQVMLSHPAPYKHYVTRDNMISTQTTADYYQRFKPLQSGQHKTVTAWSVSEPADGAAAVLLMREELVEQYGLQPLGYIRSFALTGNDVWNNMLLGATAASAKALAWAQMELGDIDLIEMHESSAAQVLANLKLFESRQFAQSHLQRDQALGSIDMDKFNINGGSLAYGSPRAITSLRVLIQALHQLQRQGGETALIASGGLGGLGAAMVLERE
ncbi:acetyl-CoA C-acyltransferase [Testudinibacter aquarius]|uniref:Acetyl-CoA C-acyltransferase n=1 Tax=Testudinibacter aquarius TaxID=1524974 RepID=A0A4R3YD80_9PAST|nr:acetyl-CoA C-acyltransferase [Testudinibacter aquarius]KAE9527446.1 acetyl-CoA acetyltransferase [Testudinibacter aquarius]TCV89970.1 acetyl-CoA acyltransferase [Testudinibacter aquarius]TNG93001.1 acetyl-CoA C-acyltransferase [Testudinibacter aquarius]